MTLNYLRLDGSARAPDYGSAEWQDEVNPEVTNKQAVCLRPVGAAQQVVRSGLDWTPMWPLYMACVLA